MLGAKEGSVVSPRSPFCFLFLFPFIAPLSKGFVFSLSFICASIGYWSKVICLTAGFEMDTLHKNGISRKVCSGHHIRADLQI